MSTRENPIIQCLRNRFK